MSKLETRFICTKNIVLDKLTFVEFILEEDVIKSIKPWSKYTIQKLGMEYITDKNERLEIHTLIPTTIHTPLRFNTWINDKIINEHMCDITDKLEEESINIYNLSSLIFSQDLGQSNIGIAILNILIDKK